MQTGSGLEARCDVVVLGSGAAELSAVKALTRSRRSVLVIDAGKPRATLQPAGAQLPGARGVAPGELLAAGRAELIG